MKKHLPGIILLWVIVGFLNAGFLNAALRSSIPDLMQSPRAARSTIAFSIGWGIASGLLGAVITPFMTGFYYSGWTLDYRPLPCTAEYPEIWCKP